MTKTRTSHPTTIDTTGRSTETPVIWREIHAREKFDRQETHRGVPESAGWSRLPHRAATRSYILSRLNSALLNRLIANHPRQIQALDRLLDDLKLDDLPERDLRAEQREQAEFDVACDNDFDGLM